MQVRGGRVEMNWFKSLWGGAANLGRSDNETIQQRIRRHVERRGGTPAVWFAPDQFCSYSQMNENATVISQALKSASGASSPRVCFPMPRGSSALYGFLGAIECGTCCPLDGKLRQNEFDEAYSVLLPDVVLSSEPQSIGVKVAAAAGIAVVIYEVSSDHGNCRIIDVKPAKNVRRADRLMTLTSGEAPAVLMRTSGTTAQPKLVGLTHANVLAATDTMRSVLALGWRQVLSLTSPASPLKKLGPDAQALLTLLRRWQGEATKAGSTINRIVVAFEAGRDGFWLARWLRARGIEAYVIHPTSIPVSREHRRAKTDRLDTGLL